MTGTTHEREVRTISEAICDCTQAQGRHAVRCVSVRANNFRRLSDALAHHDERLTRDTTRCSSCGQLCDPDNMLRVNGVPYHLGYCPTPGESP